MIFVERARSRLMLALMIAISAVIMPVHDMRADPREIPLPRPRPNFEAKSAPIAKCGDDTFIGPCQPVRQVQKCSHGGAGCYRNGKHTCACE